MAYAQSKLQLNKTVFFPPILFLVITIGYSLYDNTRFLELANTAKTWILVNFAGLFTWSTFLFLVILAIVYFSPLGKVKIGGSDAKPILTKWKWFTIATCTTIATGILFWGTAEPLYHVHQPPSGLSIAASSADSKTFAISTMFMHWSFTPYGIYTITGLVFALSYYNLRQPFRISSLLYPLLGKKAHRSLGTAMDIICLYGLVAGMAASLGAGIFALMGGLETVFGIEKSDTLLGLIGLAIVVSFIASAVSGLKKGIQILSNGNIKVFIALAIFVLLCGPTIHIFKYGINGLGDYITNFLPRSTHIGVSINDQWLYDWTIFYWTNWFAWAPISALFLGRLSVGYSVRDFIHFNLIYPSIFAILWMTIFSGSSVYFDSIQEGALFSIIQNQGEENVMYAILNELPLSKIISVITLLAIFVSYVTAADSNVSAMSAMSSTGINPENPEAPLWIKVIWGSLIGLIAWVMITTAGIDGIRLLSVLGGFPALFLIIAVAIGLVKMLVRKEIH